MKRSGTGTLEIWCTNYTMCPDLRYLLTFLAFNQNEVVKILSAILLACILLKMMGFEANFWILCSVPTIRPQQKPKLSFFFLRPNKKRACWENTGFHLSSCLCLGLLCVVVSI